MTDTDSTLPLIAESERTSETAPVSESEETLFSGSAPSVEPIVGVGEDVPPVPRESTPQKKTPDRKPRTRTKKTPVAQNDTTPTEGAGASSSAIAADVPTHTAAVDAPTAPEAEGEASTSAPADDKPTPAPRKRRTRKPAASAEPEVNGGKTEGEAHAMPEQAADKPAEPESGTMDQPAPVKPAPRRVGRPRRTVPVSEPASESVEKAVENTAEKPVEKPSEAHSQVEEGAIKPGPKPIVPRRRKIMPAEMKSKTSNNQQTSGKQSGQPKQGPSGQGQNQNGHNNNNQRRQKRTRNNEPVIPTVTKEELSELKIAELRMKAIEFGLDPKTYSKKAELVEAVFEAALKAEGFITVRGLLDITQEGFGFLRTSGYLPGENDAYVGASTIRRNGLRRGDEIVGQLRPPRENEKYPALQRIDTINGVPLAECRDRQKFADLTPVYPDERLVMEHGKNTITARTIDLVAPIGKGQRGLIVSPPKAGKTTILKDIAAAITANNPDVHLMCLLVDERPEEVTDMQRSIHGEVIASTFDMPCENHIAVAELVTERAKRLVENGEDVVILMDSITRLARAYNLAQPASGRILSGGVDSTALYPPKRFLGAARNIENGGSLTILASALIDTGSKMDEVIFEEFKGTGNLEIKLDRSLADRRIFPAIDPVTSGTRKEELLLDPQEAPFIWGVRRILANMNNTERAMEMLIKSLQQTENNQEFLVRTAKKAQQKTAQSIEL